ncbi:MAG: hypothetical protein DYG98_26185 [Haliscomenobacteraceae bacterium CHB4]|nr:hypothetical protein [Haliscomenobacteraceae bacterium CHB4]
MIKNISLFALLLFTIPVFGQEEQEILFRNARVRGGFGGPIFSWSHTNGETGYGAGGGGGVVFDRFFVGLFGMGETFDNPVIGRNQLAMGYGGLWMGFTIPSHKLVHFYASAKIAGGSVGVTDFEDDWDWDDDYNWDDVVFVAVPEAGVELNVARWMRLSGSVGYRFVDGFSGWGAYGKKDLNAPVYNLTLRFGWFGGRKEGVVPNSFN